MDKEEEYTPNSVLVTGGAGFMFVLFPSLSRIYAHKGV
jgi:hypothetical protein